MEDNIYEKKSDKHPNRFANDTNYSTYSGTVIKDVPSENMDWLIKRFMQESAINMGCEVDEKIFPVVRFLVTSKYSFLRVWRAGSAFVRGSLGDYGAGRLTPRTICGWLNEVVVEHEREQEHDKQQKIEESCTYKADLVKYPMGKAIIKKMEWFQSGSYSKDDWEKVPLKDLADRIAKGEDCMPSDYGVNRLK